MMSYFKEILFNWRNTKNIRTKSQSLDKLTHKKPYNQVCCFSHETEAFNAVFSNMIYLPLVMLLG